MRELSESDCVMSCCRKSPLKKGKLVVQGFFFCFFFLCNVLLRCGTDGHISHRVKRSFLAFNSFYIVLSE